MQIQIISTGPTGVTRMVVSELKAGQLPVKHAVQAGEKITLVVDGVTLTGAQAVVHQKLKLTKVGQSLVIETDDGQEKIVELTNFYAEKDVILTGEHWTLADGAQLQAMNDGVVLVADSNAAAEVVSAGLSVLAGAPATVAASAAAAAAALAGGNGGSKTVNPIDTQPPTTPTVNALTTSDTTPVITGTATLLAGESLTVTVNGATYNNVPVTAGVWSIDTGVAVASSGTLGTFANGQSYNVTATATDAAGNSTSDTSSNEITINAPQPPTDTEGPGAVVVSVPEASGGGINAAEAADGVPVVVTLPVGVAVGDVITVSIDGGTPVSYTVTANDINPALNPSGSVSVTLPPSAIAAAGQGDATITTRYTDAAGNAAANSPVVTTGITIDTQPPTTPTVNALTTSDTTPVITGTATLLAGESLTVTVNGATYNNVPVTAGVWSIDTGAATASSGTLGTFANGQSYNVTATVTDAAGNSASDTSSNEIIIDTQPPGAPAVALHQDTANGTDFVTSNGTLNVTGLEVGATWQYTLDGSTWFAGNSGNAATGTTGSFVAPHGSYADGNVRVRQTDAAGNASGVGVLAHPLAPAIRLDGQRGHDSLPQITSLADGGYVVSWVSDEAAVFVQRFAHDNTAMGRPQLLAGEAPIYDYDTPQITALSGGGYVVTWAATDIYVHRFDSNNAAVGSPLQLNPLGGRDLFSSATAMTDGGYVVTWTAYTANWAVNNVMVQRFDQNHLAVGSPHQLNGLSGDDLYSQVTALAGGAYVVAWVARTPSGASDIFVQRFDAANTADGPVQILADLGFGVDRPQITSLPNGGYVATWVVYPDNIGGLSDIFVQEFDPLGVPTASPHLLNRERSDFWPQITVLSDGGYVVTWDTNASNNLNLVMVQRFDSLNVAQGVPVQLQGLGTVDRLPQITALSDGGYVVTWRSESADNTTSDVLVQRFDSANVPVGSSPLQMNGLGGHDALPQVTATTTGGYVLTWRALSADGLSSDVFVQRFDAQNNVVNATLVVDTSPPSAPVVNQLTTLDTTPVITGTATLLAGERLEVTFSGAVFDNVSVDGNGDWRIDTGTATPSSGTFVPLLYEQSYSVVARTIDTANNISTDSSNNEVTTGTAPPPTTLALGTVSGIALNLIGGFTTSGGLHYYYLDLSNDGTASDSFADRVNHNALDGLFNGGTDTLDTQPGGAVARVDDARTVLVGGYTLVLPTEAELTAALAAMPNGSNQWSQWDGYWSATQTAPDFHAGRYSFGFGFSAPDAGTYVVAIQVVI